MTYNHDKQNLPYDMNHKYEEFNSKELLQKLTIKYKDGRSYNPIMEIYTIKDSDI